MARRIWDSRGRPTVEVEVVNEDGTSGIGIAPAGASRGTREAVELRDGGHRFNGLDVQHAIAGIEREIAPALVGRDPREQAGIDAMLIALDGTPNKSRLGGNALIATSLAVLHAAAAIERAALWQYLAEGDRVSLPLPQIQIFGGGAHAGRRVDVQDFMVIATGAHIVLGVVGNDRRGLSLRRRTDRPARAVGRRRRRRRLVAELLAQRGRARCPGRRRSSAPGSCPATMSRSRWTSPRPNSADMGGIDLRWSSRSSTRTRWRERLVRWIDKYPIVSIEDPLAEDDEGGLIAFTRAVGEKVQIVGDDYLVTNADRVKHAASVGACNCLLVKPNQAGTVTETRAALDAAQQAGYRTIVSARSGETEDVAIVHLAIGWNAGQLKVGSFARSERMAKWNEALRIESRSGLPFAGRAALCRP